MKRIFGFLIIALLSCQAFALQHVPESISGYMDTDGSVLENGYVAFYSSAALSSFKAVYSDYNGTTTVSQSGNGILLNSAGQPTSGGNAVVLFGSGTYWIVLKDSDGATIATYESVVYSEPSSPDQTPWINVADVYGTSDSNIQDLLTAYNGTTRVTFMFIGDFTISSNQAFTQYHRLWFANGATLTVDSGNTLTINSDELVFQNGSYISNAGTVTFNATYIDASDTNIFQGAGTYSGKLSNNVIHADWFGAVGDGDGAGGGTDNSSAIQKAMTFTVNSGGTLAFNPKTYRCDSTVTMNRTTSSHTKDLSIDGGNCVLDFKNLSSGNGLAVGASAIGFFSDKARWNIKDIKIVGPEASVPSQGGEPTSTTTGLYMSYLHAVNLQNVTVTRFKVGIRSGWVFPLTSENVHAYQNYIGLWLSNASNIHSWDLDAKECRQGVLLWKEDSVFESSRIDQVRFEQLWLEGSINGVHIDAGEEPSGTPWIRRLWFEQAYVSDIDYDVFRVNLDWDFDNAKGATRNTSALASMHGLYFNNIAWPASAATTTSAYIVFAPTGNCAEVFGNFSGQLDGKDMVNTPQFSELTILDYSGDATRDFYNIRWGSTGTQIPALDDITEGTWTPVISLDNPGDLSVAYSKQTGWYTKTGEEVTLHLNLQTSTWTHTTAGTGNIRITGLPFNPKSGTNRDYYNAIQYSGVTKNAYTQIGIGVTGGSSLMRLNAAGMNQSTTEAITSANVPSGGTVILKGQITYQADFL